MTLLRESHLTDLGDLEIRAENAAVVTWQGRPALRLENGLALLAGCRPADARIEVLVGTEGPAYPGIAFRLADERSYELAYPVPHVSGQFDALQYDPVFQGSNTWQLYCGPGYQRAAEVPTGRWFRLQLEFSGPRAALCVDGQPPLVVEQLAHAPAAGACGLWTYLPAYFAGLRVTAGSGLLEARGVSPTPAPGAVLAWHVEGHGAIACEPSGVINLNRLRPPEGAARLSRDFALAAAGPVTFTFGFSDVLALTVDGQELFRGEHTFQGFADRAARGLVEVGNQEASARLEAGTHRLMAELQVREGFGWGLALAAAGAGLTWLPAEVG